ncbi:unnamed protein product [Arctogadus glacialis]
MFPDARSAPQRRLHVNLPLIVTDVALLTRDNPDLHPGLKLGAGPSPLRTPTYNDPMSSTQFMSSQDSLGTDEKQGHFGEASIR